MSSTTGQEEVQVSRASSGLLENHNGNLDDLRKIYGVEHILRDNSMPDEYVQF